MWDSRAVARLSEAVRRVWRERISAAVADVVVAADVVDAGMVADADDVVC